MARDSAGLPDGTRSTPTEVANAGRQWWPRWESNPHWDDFESPISAGWITRPYVLGANLHRHVIG